MFSTKFILPLQKGTQAQQNAIKAPPVVRVRHLPGLHPDIVQLVLDANRSSIQSFYLQQHQNHYAGITDVTGHIRADKHFDVGYTNNHDTEILDIYVRTSREKLEEDYAFIEVFVQVADFWNFRSYTSTPPICDPEAAAEVGVIRTWQWQGSRITRTRTATAYSTPSNLWQAVLGDNPVFTVGTLDNIEVPGGSILMDPTVNDFFFETYAPGPHTVEYDFFAYTGATACVQGYSHMSTVGDGSTRSEQSIMPGRIWVNGMAGDKFYEYASWTLPTNLEGVFQHIARYRVAVFMVPRDIYDMQLMRYRRP